MIAVQLLVPRIMKIFRVENRKRDKIMDRTQSIILSVTMIIQISLIIIMTIELGPIINGFKGLQINLSNM